MDTLRHYCKALDASAHFRNGILALIIINAVLLGMETSNSIMAEYGPALLLADQIILGIFVAEIIARIIAHGARFFRDPWSLFDCFVVGIALIPDTGAFSALRTLRVLRVLRIISTIPGMRRVVASLLSAIPAISSVLLIMLLIFYVFAVIGTKLYAADFPEWFGTLGLTMFTLFQIMTLESWSMGIVRPVMDLHPYAWVYFVTYILVTTFTMLNLFIAILVNAMHESADLEAEQSREVIRADIIREMKKMEKRLTEKIQK